MNSKIYDNDEGIWYSKSDPLLLFIVILLFTALFSYFSYLRYANFFTGNWDLGIVRQALWTYTHGHLFYESADYETFGVLSFLQIHSSYLAFPISYIYLLYPKALTVFVIQGLMLSATSIPIFFLSRRIGVGRIHTYFLIIVFLLNFSVLSGVFYDFHWESFIPLEMFSLLYFIMEKKYYLSLVVFFLGCATLEIFPFILVGFVFYYLLANHFPFLKIKSFNTEIPTKVLLSFLTVSILSYAIIRSIQFLVIPPYVGMQSNPTGVSGTFTGLVSINLSLQGLSRDLFYWSMMLLSLALLPVFAPEVLLMASPWIFYSTVVDPSLTNFFGNQYALLSFPFLFLATMSAVRKLEMRETRTINLKILLLLAFSSAILAVPLYGTSLSHILVSENFPVIVLSAPVICIAILYWYYYRREEVIKTHKINQKSFRFGVAFFFVVIIFNLVMSPLNLENFHAGPMPGYAFSYSTNPEFKQAQELASMFPGEAQVLASNNLFSLVANDANAYSLSWQPFKTSLLPYLPFNASNLPNFLFLDSSEFYVPSYLSNAIFNSSSYGLRASTYYSSYPGTILLYQKGYSGKTVFLGPNTFPQEQVFKASNLFVGPDGTILTERNSSFEKVISSRTCNANKGDIWYGPYITLTPGNYTLTVSLELNVIKTNNYTGPILTLKGGIAGTYTIYNSTVNDSELKQDRWVNVTIDFNIKHLLFNLEFVGLLAIPNNCLSDYQVLLGEEVLERSS